MRKTRRVKSSGLSVEKGHPQSFGLRTLRSPTANERGQHRLIGGFMINIQSEIDRLWATISNPGTIQPQHITAYFQALKIINDIQTNADKEQSQYERLTEAIKDLKQSIFEPPY